MVGRGGLEPPTSAEDLVLTHVAACAQRAAHVDGVDRDAPTVGPSEEEHVIVSPLNGTHQREGPAAWTWPGPHRQPPRGIGGASAPPEHAVGMTDRDDFLTWVKTALYEAELA